MIPNECSTSSKVSHIKVTDKKSTCATFSNPQRLKHTLIAFDGCVKKNEVACDWIVEREKIGRIAVELKGVDVEHAAKQVGEGLKYLKDNDMVDLPVAGLIVCSRYPRIDTKIQRLKQEIAKVHKAPLTVTTKGHDLCFDALLRF